MIAPASLRNSITTSPSAESRRRDGLVNDCNGARAVVAGAMVLAGGLPGAETGCTADTVNAFGMAMVTRKIAPFWRRGFSWSYHRIG